MNLSTTSKKMKSKTKIIHVCIYDIKVKLTLYFQTRLWGTDVLQTVCRGHCCFFFINL